ncbi:MAG: aspartate--tRNA ligase, partial [Verrucomicrobiota bacterium]|nr:aspartate--tRNA ligase [Verrucomicrobiota bacterium]
DHGGIIFIDLRDHYGISQVVIHPQKDFYKAIEHWRKESVICFTGTLVKRTEETVNTRIATGKVELEAEQMTILSDSKILPFQISVQEECPETTRLKYRFLDLRRKKLHERIIRRSQIITEMRKILVNNGFNEFQTPILTASSPEGARDYLVPSRVHPGKFYALPQAPQQFKQLLMVSGFDKYFQIAPCFRDEDARADRSPGEFYQLDLEMSFVTQEEIFQVVEETLIPIFKKFSSGADVDELVCRIPYKEAMEKYGCDKPDLRNPLTMIDVTDVFAASEFRAFANVAKKKNGAVKAIAAKGIADQPKSFYESMITYAQSVGAKGLGYIIWKNGEAKSPIANYLTDEQIKELAKAGGVKDGDVMFFIADKKNKALEIGSQVIPELGKRLELIDKKSFKFCWIVDYPMFEYDPAEKKIGFSHNPFSMPQGEMEALKHKDPLDVLAYQYDLVCNGVELSSGAIRNHKPEIMYKAFNIAGYSKKTVNEEFSGMINAFKFGAPPHGGIAPGVDRIVMLLTEVSNIREIIAFPFNQQAQDLMMNAPANVSNEQLKELSIEIKLPEEDEEI